jgi:hypothetical protein
MAQIIENWADVTGSVAELDPDAAPPGFVSMRVLVARVEAVEGSPNLLGELAGSTLEIRVPDGALGLDVRPGVVVRCRVRRAVGGAVFAHPDGLRAERSGGESV